jgi:pimeloyl-ACP methyl ester carboxylesterase
MFLATLGLADQSRQARPIRVERIDVTGASVRLEVAAVRATFTGVMTGDRAEIRGTWVEGRVSYPLVLTRRDLTRSLVSVFGREVEVVRMGEGSPTLVLESGGGESAGQWSRILPELARQTRVITYSRAGFGKSTASPLPGSPQSSVAELHALLQELGETGPFVLGGHSWGALLARLYVSTFPADVVGLVLIDGTHEAQ